MFSIDEELLVYSVGLKNWDIALASLWIHARGKHLCMASCSGVVELVVH
jgi:hypothetical protein